jgi:neurofibromin 1
MTYSLRLFFEEVSADGEKTVSIYQVDPRRLDPGDIIEDNQRNFQELFQTAVDTIAGLRKTMPVGILRKSQMVYHKVYDKSQVFATQILSGFLFLRFLLPAFTVPKMVELPELLPERTRQALVQTSTMLMIATLKGPFGDRGVFMSVPFSELAATARRVFQETRRTSQTCGAKLRVSPRGFYFSIGTLDSAAVIAFWVGVVAEWSTERSIA